MTGVLHEKESFAKRIRAIALQLRNKYLCIIIGVRRKCKTKWPAHHIRLLWIKEFHNGTRVISILRW
jgi:hypothetical protein